MIYEKGKITSDKILVSIKIEHAFSSCLGHDDSLLDKGQVLSSSIKLVN